MSPIFLIIAGIPLLSLVWWWWADRRLKALGAGRWWRIAATLGVLVLLAGFFWVIIDRRGLLPVNLPAPWYAMVLLWGLIFMPFLGLPSMLGWAVWSLGRNVGRLVRGKKIPAGGDGGAPWTRRRWLGAAAVTFPLLGTLGSTLYSLPRMTRFRLRKMTLTLESLPAALDGMTIVHVTDTHVGKFTRGHVLDDIIAEVNRLDADLILFTGDLIDRSLRDLPEAIGMLQKLRSKSGLFLIEGNHDLFDNAEGFVKDVRAGGLNLLRNQAVTTKVRGAAVQILGIQWHHGEDDIAADVLDVAGLREPDSFPILLAHHPHAFDRAAALDFPLTLAGHTHGGQLMLTQEKGAGPMMFRYWSGLYRKGRSQLVVSNGTGNWFPLRLNAPAEIIELTLKRA